MAEEEKKTTTGLPPKTAAALSYVLGWITGLVFLLIEKDDQFVRFHAMQSIVTFGGLTIISMVPIIGWFLTPMVAILGFILWLLLIYKAYQGEEYSLPWVGDFARQLLGKV